LKQKIDDIERVEPSFWWSDVKHQQLQLVIYGNQIAQRNVSINYNGVTLQQVIKVEEYHNEWEITFKKYEPSLSLTTSVTQVMIVIWQNMV
jgi:hypothetical protein